MKQELIDKVLELGAPDAKKYSGRDYQKLVRDIREDLLAPQEVPQEAPQEVEDLASLFGSED